MAEFNDYKFMEAKNLNDLLTSLDDSSKNAYNNKDKLALNENLSKNYKNYANSWTYTDACLTYFSLSFCGGLISSSHSYSLDQFFNNFLVGAAYGGVASIIGYKFYKKIKLLEFLNHKKKLLNSF